MSMMFRDMHLWTVTFHADVPIRQIHQSYSEHLGDVREELKANILCEYKEMARAYIERQFAHQKVEIIKVEREINLHAIIMNEWVDTISDGKKIGPERLKQCSNQSL